MQDTLKNFIFSYIKTNISPKRTYPAGVSKQASSKTQATAFSSLIGVTPGTGSSRAKIFPKVILAFNT